MCWFTSPFHSFVLISTMSASSHPHMCGLHSSQPRHLSLLHYLGAALSFTCICFYTIMLTELTRRCVLTRYERFLYPFRIVSTVLQICLTICCILIGDICLRRASHSC